MVLKKTKSSVEKRTSAVQSTLTARVAGCVRLSQEHMPQPEDLQTTEEAHLAIGMVTAIL